MIHVIAQITLQSGCRSDFLTEFHKLVPLVHAEQGCLEYGPAVDAETPIDAQVTNVDASSRKLSLSIKAREMAEEKKAMAEFGSSDSGASLGDILGAAMAKRNEDDK